MFFFKQLGIAIVILVVLSTIIYFMNKKAEKFELGNSNPYGTLDYIANPNGLNSSVPIML
jgi:hypothetical protein